ncbi:MAG: transporter ATP-binding protein [Ilumatobacteraceae bacterium]|nr:transporter ATP-binding protein [Ilumatobacteraceae bacterium]
MSASAATSAPLAPANVVRLADVSHGYATRQGTLTVLDHIDLTIGAGEIVGISGPSGTGKSTLLRIAAGLEEPAGGALRYGDHDPWHGRRARARYPRRSYVMPVFQDPYASLDPRWPIWRTIAEPLAATDRGGARRAAAASLERIGLQHLDLDARPRELSGGQCQRVAILRALAARPALLIADEPTARQDLITAAAVGHLLRDAADRGCAILVVSHNAPWLSSVSDSVHRLVGGRLVAGG